MNLKKLMIIQTKLNAPKNQHNNFGNYNYRSCEDILMAVKPLLEETDTSLTVSDTVELVWERFYIKATATLYDNETWEEIASTTALAREQDDKKGMDQAQITGASSSYARKYALNWLFCIDDNRDPDAQTPSITDPSAMMSMNAEQVINVLNGCKTSTELSTYSPVIIKLKSSLSDADYQSIKEAYNNKLKELK